MNNEPSDVMNLLRHNSSRLISHLFCLKVRQANEKGSTEIDSMLDEFARVKRVRSEGQSPNVQDKVCYTLNSPTVFFVILRRRVLLSKDCNPRD